MRTTHSQLTQIRKDFKKRLSDIRREEIRILSKLRTEVDRKKVSHLQQSLTSNS